MMDKRHLLGLLFCGLAVLVLVGPATANYDVGPKNSQDGSPVPDVDKAGLPAPPGDDFGCWAATAANVLGAADWGVGINAQTKADNIYQDFINEFKLAADDTYLKAAGDCCGAAKWWVHNIGLDVADEGGGYSPTNTYVNFSCVTGTLNELEYNFLLNELSICQYASVFWMTGGDTGHCMTMVGGNYGPSAPSPPAPANQTLPCVSVWHNSDDEGPVGDDEVYNNVGFVQGQNNTWLLDTTPNNPDDNPWVADGYFLACPGVPKPENAIGNFDVHCYIGLKKPAVGLPTNPVPTYGTEVQMLTTGANHGPNKYTGPDGQIDAEWDDTATETILIVPNEVVVDKYKILYISVDFNFPENPADTTVDDIIVYDDDGVTEIPLDDILWAPDNGQVLLKYVFEDQPDWETIVFPSDEYKDLMGQFGYNVLEWNIATECIPEPATLALLALGAVILIRRRRR